MSEGNQQFGTQQTEPPQSAGLRGCQFSLGSMLAIMTALAIILSIFFSIGQLFGMSTIDVLTRGLGPFLYILPTLVVWLIGLVVSVRRLKLNRYAAILTIIALSVLLVTAFVHQFIQMVLIHLISSQRISTEAFSWTFTGIGFVSTVVHTICWILILMAIFRGRPQDVSKGERNDPTGDSTQFM